MPISWEWFFIIGVISSKSSFYSSSLIYQNVKGSLSNSWYFNFTISVKDFKGVILYIFDSVKNQFSMTVQISGNDKFVLLKFKRSFKLVPLLKLCGCDKCDFTVMNFYIEAKDKLIKVRCNNNDVQTLPIEGQEDNNDKHKYNISKSSINVSHTIYIMMGNIKQYNGEDNVTVFPLKDEMVGCLENFFFKREEVSFIKEGAKMETFCSPKYFRDICNGGVYKVKTGECDCFSTALNGPYCNRSLKMYLQGENNSYEKRKEVSHIYLKMTWMHQLHKNYCLMEVVGGSKVLSIWTNKTHVMVDFTSISDFSDIINFMNINITNNNLIIKIKDKEIKFQMTLFEGIKIHVGKCKANKNYETFEGFYDLHFDSSQLKSMNQLKNISSNEQKTTVTFNLIYIISGSLVTLSLIIIAIIIVLFRRRIKEINFRLETLTLPSSSLPRISVQETYLYSKVEDSNEYAYIHEIG